MAQEERQMQKPQTKKAPNDESKLDRAAYLHIMCIAYIHIMCIPYIANQYCTCFAFM